MNLYIFGAGASKASQEGLVDDSHIPPLVNELFDEKYYGYAKLIHLPTEDLMRYKASLETKSLEQWLTDWWDRIGKIPETDVQYGQKAEFGKLTFYIWWLMQNISNSYTPENLYRTFLLKLKIRSEYPKIISFNYDLLLDRALIEVFGRILDVSIEAGYTSSKFIKPHGSINWFLKRRSEDCIIGSEMGFSIMVRFDTASSQMFNGAPLSLNQVEVINPNHKDMMNSSFISHGRFDNQYFYPLILIPLTKKLYPFFTFFNEKIISEGQKLIANVSDIYLIGYRANDETFNKDLLPHANEGTKLHVVSLSDAENIMDNVLKQAKNLTRGKIYNGGFGKFIDGF